MTAPLMILMMKIVNLLVKKRKKKIKMLTGQILMVRKVVSMLMAIRLKERKKDALNLNRIVQS
jgi:hypothetical protein